MGRATWALLAGVALTSVCCFDLGSEEWVVEPINSNDGGTGTSTSTLMCPHVDNEPHQALVEMINNAFVPNVLHICVGDTVVWRNRDTKEHTVYTGTPEAPDGVIASDQIYFGQTFSHTFVTLGDYLYFCSTHRKIMRDAHVIVE